MDSRFERMLGRAVAAWVGGVMRRPRAVGAVMVLLTLALAGYTATHLGVTTDTQAVIDPDVRSRVLYDAFSRDFPGLNDAILVLIDAETPELARTSATALAGALAAQPDRFEDVFAPGGGPFFETHALLYQDLGAVEELTDQLASFQPVIAELERDPSIASFARLVGQGLRRGQETDQFGPEQWSTLLDRIGDATVAVYDEFPVSISWEQVMLEGSPIEARTRRILIVEPVLHADALLAGRPALDAIRASAAQLGLDPEHGVRVRLTGNPALAYEEMWSLARDVGLASLLSFGLVTMVLRLALRSGRLALVSALTLLVSLIWTAAFAAVSVGQLNVVSIAFAILVIGLGIDFGIHLGMHYADARSRGLEHAPAMLASAEKVGSSLVMCTVTTSIGFFVFIPTEFLGVAQLAMIAGGGVVVSLIQTLTFLPALLSGWLPLHEAPPAGAALRFHGRWIGFASTHAGIVVGIAVLFAVGAAFVAPSARFDANAVNLRDPNTESVQAFDELLAERDSTPWYVNAVAPSLPAAQARADLLRALPVVDRVITLADYVPVDQDEKLEVLADAHFLLEAPQEMAAYAPPSTDDQILALKTLMIVLSDPTFETSSGDLAASMRRLRDEIQHFLTRAEHTERPEEALEKLEALLLGGFDEHMARMRRGLSPGRIDGPEDLPDQIVRRMQAPDGRARLQIFPAENVGDQVHLEAFIDGVAELEPEVVGVGANLLELLRITIDSLQQALVSALVAIAILLFLIWGRAAEMALVMFPLLLATLLTWAGTVVFGIPFSYSTVIVIPMLLGIGVDSGIHLVHRSHSEMPPEGLLGTPTARAVFYSALTTIASFGTLSLASHRGVANMGELLLVGMLLMLICNLAVLPALIALRQRRAAR